MFRPAFALLALLAVHHLPLAAQQPASHAPVDVPRFFHLVRTGPEQVIHAADPPLPQGLTPVQRIQQLRQRIYDNLTDVTLEVILNENGRVDSARAVDGPKQFYEQAEQIEMHRVFEPVHIDGTIQRVRAHDYVRVLPPEEMSGTHVPFPAEVDLRTVSLQLQRTACFGSCPAYTVTVHGDGQITFRGEYQVAIPGTHTARVSVEVVRRLFEAFRAADFLSAKDEYRCGWTDMPTQTLTLTMGDRTKQVVDYGGDLVGLPDAVRDLEKAIDDAVDVDRWVKGNAQTGAALRAERWNLAASTPENLALFNAAIERENGDLVHAFLDARAPVIDEHADKVSPVCSASEKGDLGLVKQMLASRPSSAGLGAPLLAQCLSASARSGKLALVDFWLDKGARPGAYVPSGASGADWRVYQPPLLAAVQSDNPLVLARLLSFHPDVSPAANLNRSLLTVALQRGTPSKDAKGERVNEMLRQLIAAGADVNAKGSNDPNPPIFEVSQAPEAVSLLVAAGADPNLRGRNGATPLMRNCFVPAAVQALLAAGADPALRDRRGENALDNARRFPCPECIAMLQKAMTTHAGQGQAVP